MYQQENQAFCLNVSIGLILRHLETRELRYFIPHHNHTISKKPVTISQHSDIDKVKYQLLKLNIREYITTQTPTMSLTGFVLGDGELP